MAIIVLADDDADVRVLYGSCLRQRGYEVREAIDGAEAVELVRRYRPSLLILDVWMPRLNGFEVIESLRYEPASVGMNIIMLSVLDDAEVQLEAFSGGACEYFVKGVEIARFLERVGEMLKQSPDDSFFEPRKTLLPSEGR